MDESTLKALLDSLDKSRPALDGWMTFWTWLVVIGVIADIVFAIHVYWDELSAWRRGIVRPPDRPSMRWFVCELLAIGLVVVGIAGELVIESKIGTLETSIRKYNGQLQLLLEKKAQDAETSAQGATADAKTAHDLATATGKEANGFAKEIASAKEQATKAETDLQASLVRTARLENSLSWRTVTPEQTQKIKASLSPLRLRFKSPLDGIKISFTYETGNEEGYEYAKELKDALSTSLEGFNAQVSEPSSMVAIGQGPPAAGLFLEVSDPKNPAAIILQRALGAAGIVADGQITKFLGDDIAFFVGVKPRPTQK